jgi:hypothetical protein
MFALIDAAVKVWHSVNSEYITRVVQLDRCYEL